MYLCLIITIDCERSTLLVTVNMSYLVIVLMGLTMVVNIQYYFLSLDLISKWLTRDIG